MAHNTTHGAHEDTSSAHNTGQNALTLSLSFLAGAGLLMMITALIIGTINGESAGTSVGLLFVLGIAALISGIGAWLAVARPFEHFDDINVPMDNHPHGHPVEEHGEVHVMEALPASTGTAAQLPEHASGAHH